MKFKDFLNKKALVFTFGRMNPFTFGHYHLAQKLVDESGYSHKPRIYLSHTTNPKKDPLSYNDKLKFAKDALQYYNIDVKKSKARTIIEVAKELEAEGFTDIVLVVGSDRVQEFKTLLDKYNRKEYTFNSIKIISAGKRDPDAEGVEGMSASKVREFAAKGDFENFKKSVPFLPKTAKELYDKVRKGMNINEEIDLDEEFEELLTEGVHDKGIFKAVFLAGGPGSGKDYVLSNTLDGQGLVEINSDKALEFLMDKKGLDKTMPAAEKASRDQVRGRAKDITELKQRLALKGRNGLIINGTGDDVEKITRIKKKLEDLGYESSMLMVNTSDEVSAARNIERGQRGGRTVPETIRKQKWDAAQNARTEYAKMFGSNYMEFDNSEDLRSADPDTVKAKKMELTQLFKNVQDFIAKPPKNPKAEEWVAQELEKKDTYKVPQDGVEQIPPSGDQGASEAQKLGLKYYGFGRYGINGKVTHRSIHGKLVPVKKEEPKDKPKPKVKKESIDVEIQGLLSENFDLSDSSALNLLLLGTEIDEHDLPIGEEKEVKLLKDKAGRVRIFMLRAAAAREAHTSGGQVLKYKNGYVVQLKENHNVNETNSKDFRTWYESRRNEASARWTNQSSNREISGETRTYLRETTEESKTQLGKFTDNRRSNTITEETNQETSTRKITLAEIRAKKEKLQEETLSEIDKGIEPGLSMAASGENMSRGTLKVKQIKKPLEELTGDETTASISAQVEDGLKKKGMDLKTFRSKRPIG